MKSGIGVSVTIVRGLGTQWEREFTVEAGLWPKNLARIRLWFAIIRTADGLPAQTWVKSLQFPCVWRR